MKYLLLILCLILCSCSSEKEAEHENSKLPSSSSESNELCIQIGDDCIPVSCQGAFCSSDPPDDLFKCLFPSASSGLPSSGSAEPEPSILDCAAEDIAEYPAPIESDEPNGWCETHPRASVEELSFSKEGGVRCVTTSDFMNNLSLRGAAGCRIEFEMVSDTVNVPPTFLCVNKFKREVCSWLTATKVGERVIHISVAKNETGSEREMDMFLEAWYCGSMFTITQSAD